MLNPHACLPAWPQVVGPVAVTSILLGNGLSDFMPSEEDPNNPVDAQVQENYNHAAIQIAFIAGCFYFAFGLFRMGERGALESVQGLKSATATAALKCDCCVAGLQAGSPTSCRAP